MRGGDCSGCDVGGAGGEGPELPSRGHCSTVRSGARAAPDPTLGAEGVAAARERAAAEPGGPRPWGNAQWRGT